MQVKLYLSVLFLSVATVILGQDEMDLLLESEMGNTTEYAMGTFFSTRILNGQSTQMMPKKGLDFRVHHRFDNFNEGFNRFWGIDGSYSYLSLEYGVTDRIMAGIGRQNDGYFNSFGKFTLLRQCKGAKNIPVTMVWHSSMSIFAYIYENDKARNQNFNGRLSYTHQLLVARMFSPKLSLQLMPTFVHRNMVATPDHNNDLYAMGIGGRFKITNSVSVNAEYYYVHGNKNLPEAARVTYYDPIAVGVDIQLSGHVFQLMITNSQGMIEPSFLGETTYNAAKGDVRLGFNISQVFTLGRK